MNNTTENGRYDHKAAEKTNRGMTPTNRIATFWTSFPIPLGRGCPLGIAKITSQPMFTAASCA